MIPSVQMEILFIMHHENTISQLLLSHIYITYICISNLLVPCSTGKAVAASQKLLQISNVIYSVLFHFLFLKWVEQEIILPL